MRNRDQLLIELLERAEQATSRKEALRLIHMADKLRNKLPKTEHRPWLVNHDHRQAQ